MIKSLITAALVATSLQAQADKVNLTLELEGLSAMRGQHYEGWNIINGEAHSTGRFSIKANKVFSVDAMGRLMNELGPQDNAQFEVDRSHLGSSVFVLTIEPNGDTDPGPSAVHIMGGDYNRGLRASLTLDHGSSLGTDFAHADGSFILAAPTGGAFNKGVWFVNPAEGVGSLQLPELPEAFAYEGWIVNTTNGKKFSTGIFKTVNGADADGAGPLAGPLKLSFPPTPGQDIVRSSVVLDDGIHAIVISVEPYPDFDPAPYDIKVLKADVQYGAPGMTPLDLNNIAHTQPKGVVHIH